MGSTENVTILHYRHNACVGDFDKGMLAKKGALLK